MLICATHTHTAPKGGEGTPGKEAYEKLKHEKLEEAIVKAIQSLQPARVGFGSDYAIGVGFSRKEPCLPTP